MIFKNTIRLFLLGAGFLSFGLSAIDYKPVTYFQLQMETVQMAYNKYETPLHVRYGVVRANSEMEEAPLWEAAETMRWYLVNNNSVGFEEWRKYHHDNAVSEDPVEAKAMFEAQKQRFPHSDLITKDPRAQSVGLIRVLGELFYKSNAGEFMVVVYMSTENFDKFYGTEQISHGLVYRNYFLQDGVWKLFALKPDILSDGTFPIADIEEQKALMEAGGAITSVRGAVEPISLTDSAVMTELFKNMLKQSIEN